MMRLEKLTGAAVPVISTADAKAFLRVSGSSEDTVIASLVAAATEVVERNTNLKLINQVWRAWSDGAGSITGGEWWDGTRDMAISALAGTQSVFVLPVAPLQNVVQMVTYSLSNTETVFPSSNYFIDKSGYRPRLILNQSITLPQTRDLNGIAIDMTLGFGAAATDVPADLVQAVRLMLAHLYENRGDENVALPDSVKNIISRRVDIRL